MQGLGNDFLVFDAAAIAADTRLDSGLLRALADRHTGVGFDQALMLESPRDAASRVFYRVFNSDGTEVEQCGNGARCIAALLYCSRAAAGPRTHDGLPGRNRACASQGRRLGVGGHGRAELRSALRADTVRRVCGYLFLERRRRRPRDQRPLHGQSACGAARSRCENSAGGAAWAQYRASPALSEARQCGLHADRGSRPHAACACSNAAWAKLWPAARGRAPPLRSAGGCGLLEAEVRVDLPGGTALVILGGSWAEYVAHRTCDDGVYGFDRY